MTKKIRLLAAAMAACMSLTMFAGAADMSAEDNAAEVCTGMAHVIQEDGSMVDVPFEYTVPADASEEEAAAIGLDAANQAAWGDTQTFTARATTTQEESISNVVIPKKTSALSNTYLRMTLDSRKSRIAVILQGVTGCSTVNVSLYNNNHEDETIYKVNTAQSNMEVVFYDRCVADDGHSILFLNSGDRITARISGDQRGSVSLFKMVAYSA